MLETPQERVRLLKAGIDGKTIERLYLIYNDIKVIRNPILSGSGRMPVSPPAVRRANKNDIFWSAKIFSLAYIDGTSSIILRSIYPDYSTLIIYIASCILIYFMVQIIRKTDWGMLFSFLRKNPANI